ncbi:dual specificity protein phosphatase 19-like isoform X1 [Acanthaster planci]|uniref:Dual specificity protein phosphatase 19-like isoform X1 n=1 Tax=Acanthaster planci TaxID=133434 RepID=A0A8B7ZBG4_ACAPL|nr:dual specificity protein phosphatase 19-like isoform X1 [Acanthaster planci]
MSFLEDIASFPRSALKQVETQVTTPGGHILVETRVDGSFTQRPVEGKSFGFVGDVKPDFQVVEVRPGLLFGSQDVATNLELLNQYKVTHILNVATGISNVFPDNFIYKTVEILDLPGVEITGHFEECFEFIDSARDKGKALVHCNAGVSRAPSIVIGYIMSKEGASFQAVFEELKGLRPAIRPNDGFRQSLVNYEATLMNRNR